MKDRIEQLNEKLKQLRQLYDAHLDLMGSDDDPVANAYCQEMKQIQDEIYALELKETETESCKISEGEQGARFQESLREGRFQECAEMGADRVMGLMDPSDRSTNWASNLQRSIALAIGAILRQFRR